MCVIGKIKWFLAVLLLFGCEHSFAVNLKVCSFNIRYDSGIDGINCWENRKRLLLKYLKDEGCDIICLQEVLHQQYVFLKDNLEKYDIVGSGRNDGLTKGEYAPILFKKKNFEILGSGMYWLSESTDVVGSIGWDAKQPRIATWVLLKVRRTGKELLVVNTHLDDVGKTARLKSVELIISRTVSCAETVILTGDFNSPPHSQVYETIANDNTKFDDTSVIANRKYGVDYTFHNFGLIPIDGRSKIDFIFGRGLKRVKRVEIPKEIPVGNVFLSDHNPIIAFLSI